MITLPFSTGKEGMHWIYLSPHMDDAALSCGGLIADQVAAGQLVSVWTICAGDPPAPPFSPLAESLHARWGTGASAVEQRRREDLLSCSRLGAECRQFSLPDCIYRRDPLTGQYLYTLDGDLMGALHPAEYPLVEDLSRELADLLPSAYTLVVPLALGGHVDHRLVRAAAERLVASGASAWFYADYPYVLGYTTELDLLRQAGWIPCSNPVSPEGITAWQDAIAAHTSQISTFWPDLAAMQEAIQAYCDAYQGVQLWKKGE